jgi:hypothetical protein
MSAPKIEVLNASAKNRSYYEVAIDGDRLRLDRVTSLLKGEPKDALGYAQTYGAVDAAIARADTLAQDVKADPEKVRKELAGAVFPQWKKRADTGSAFHARVESHILGEGRAPLIPEGVDGVEVGEMFEQFLRWEDHYKPEYEAVEVQVLSLEHNYMGTADLLCRINGELVLCDWKTTKRESKTGGPGVYCSQAMQLAAYVNAEYLIDSRAGVCVPMPKVESASIAWIARDDYELVPMNVTDETFELFLNVAAVYRGINRKDKNRAGGPWWRSADVVMGAAA